MTTSAPTPSSPTPSSPALILRGGGRLPALGLGTWKSAPGEVGAAVQAAIRMGYRHIDCAAIYGNEAEIGQAIAALIASGEVRREQLWITSKLWNSEQHPQDVRPAIEATLRDLQLEYLDLYLIHWPVAIRRGLPPGAPGACIPRANLPLVDTWAAMLALVEQGLVRHVGVSNFAVTHLEAVAVTGQMPEVNQIELHPFLQQDALLAWCNQNQVAITAYSPLGSRDRAPFMRAANEPILLEHPTVHAVARRVGCTPAQVLIQWSIARGCSVIPKSTHTGRLAENLAAASVVLSQQDMTELASMNRNWRYLDGGGWTRGDSPYTLTWLWGTNA